MVNDGARIEVLFSIVLDDRLEIGINLSVHDIAYLLEGQKLPWMDDFIYCPFSFPIIHGAIKDNQFLCYF